MEGIYRLLCTHCTFGTSVLETTTTDNAAKVLGYSVRKSSLPDADRGAVRTVFRAVERLLSYQLPKDAPAGAKDLVDADSAPRRLIFLPKLGGWQVAAQVAYRTHDTAGRPGSYFADVLASPVVDSRRPGLAAQEWSPVEILRLLGTGHDRVQRTGWWISSEEQLVALEASDRRCLEAPTTSPEALRGENRPLIDDDLLRAFLTAEACPENDGAMDLVPPRWWAWSAAQRRELVESMLQSAICSAGGREAVIIAAEPAVAAVLFYAVCRLLPGSLARTMGFSTYEPEPERAMTQLVATTFFDERSSSSDLPADLYQRGFACNTFRNLSQRGRAADVPPVGYVHTVVNAAVAGDWETLESLHQSLDALGRIEFRSLDGLAAVDADVLASLAGETRTPQTMRLGDMEREFRRRRFLDHVVRLEADGHEAWPRDFLWLAVDALGPSLEEAWRSPGPLRAMLERHLPDNDHDLERLLAAQPAAPPDLLSDAVVRVARALNPPRLPPAFTKYCARDAQPAGITLKLMSRVLDQLPAASRDAILLEQLTPEVAGCIFNIVATCAKKDQPTNAPPRIPLPEMVLRSLEAPGYGPEQRAAFLHKHAAIGDLIAATSMPPPVSAVLARFFSEALSTVYHARGVQPGSLLACKGESRVKAFRKWTLFTLEAPRFNRQLDAWQGLHDCVRELRSDATRSDGKALRPLKAPEWVDRALHAFDAVGLSLESGSPLPRSTLLSPTLRGLGLDPDAPPPPVRSLKARIDQSAPKGKASRSTKRPSPMVLALGGGGILLLLAVSFFVARMLLGPPPAPVNTENHAGQSPEAAADSVTGTGRKKAGSDTGSGTNGVASATSAAADASPPRPPKPPPPNPDDVEVTLENGTFTVTCVPELLKSGSFELAIQSPLAGGSTATLAFLTMGTPSVQYDTSGKGFGTYTFRLGAGPEVASHIEKKFELLPPAISGSGARCRILASSSVVLIDAPFAPPSSAIYGSPAYSLQYVVGGTQHAILQAEGSRDSTTKDVVFDISRSSVLPDAIRGGTVQIDLVANVPAGPCQQHLPLPPPLAVTPDQALAAWLETAKRIPDDAPGKRFLEHRAFALPEEYPSTAVRLSDIPWNVDPKDVSFCLFAPEFAAERHPRDHTPMRRIILKDAAPVAAGLRRVRCIAECLPRLAGSAPSEIEIGSFQLGPGSDGNAWSPVLSFVPVQDPLDGTTKNNAYAMLRRCMVGIRVHGGLTTHQLAHPIERGPLSVNVTAADNKTKAAEIPIVCPPRQVRIRKPQLGAASQGLYFLDGQAGEEAWKVDVHIKRPGFTTPYVLKSKMSLDVIATGVRVSTHPFKWNDGTLLASEKGLEASISTNKAEIEDRERKLNETQKKLKQAKKEEPSSQKVKELEIDQRKIKESIEKYGLEVERKEKQLNFIQLLDAPCRTDSWCITWDAVQMWDDPLAVDPKKVPPNTPITVYGIVSTSTGVAVELRSTAAPNTITPPDIPHISPE
jgi:hypothetical protein